MTQSSIPFFLAGFLFFATLAVIEPSLGQVGQDPDAPKMRKEEKKESTKKEPWESLRPEQREKLREALREVWTDPAVISAREDVKQASEVYQAAIATAVSRVDPSVADIITRIQKDNRGRLHGDIWDRSPKGTSRTGHPPTGTAPKKGFDHLMKPPGFMESLPPEVREKVRKAEAAAMTSDAVQSAKAEMESIRTEDEALRRKRLEAHRKFRKVTIEEMVRIDPSIAALQKKLSGGGRKRPPSSSRREGEKQKHAPEQDKKPASRPLPKPDSAPGDIKPE